MAIFDTGYSPVTAVGTVPVVIFNSGSVNTGSRDVTVMNLGATTVYLSTVAGTTCTNIGVQVAQGQQLTLQGGTAGTFYANTQVVGTSSTCQAGLATLASVI